MIGLHWEGKVLLKKARRKGLRECIHSAYERVRYLTHGGERCFDLAAQIFSCLKSFQQHVTGGYRGRLMSREHGVEVEAR